MHVAKDETFFSALAQSFPALAREKRGKVHARRQVQIKTRINPTSRSDVLRAAQIILMRLSAHRVCPDGGGGERVGGVGGVT